MTAVVCGVPKRAARSGQLERRAPWALTTAAGIAAGAASSGTVPLTAVTAETVAAMAAMAAMAAAMVAMVAETEAAAMVEAAAAGEIDGGPFAHRPAQSAVNPPKLLT
jgi:hypothetical protein